MTPLCRSHQVKCYQSVLVFTTCSLTYVLTIQTLNSMEIKWNEMTAPSCHKPLVIRVGLFPKTKVVNYCSFATLLLVAMHCHLAIATMGRGKRATDKWSFVSASLTCICHQYTIDGSFSPGPQPRVRTSGCVRKAPDVNRGSFKDTFKGVLSCPCEGNVEGLKVPKNVADFQWCRMHSVAEKRPKTTLMLIFKFI